jgi:hypothetical protein
MRVLVALLVIILCSHAASAKYCASYYDGTQDCGIATLQACEQSVRGVGGTCVADDTSPLTPRVNRMPFDQLIQGAEPSQDYQRPRSPALDDVPPPPGN